MSDDTRCDWCLRRLAPEELESATTDEQRDGYCWGPGDALCDEIHGEEWKRLQSVRPATPADDTCDTCGRPLATDADEQATSPGEGEDLCWREYQGGVCTGEPVDWRRLYLVEADARIAAEGACECAEAEVAQLREQVAEGERKANVFARRWRESRPIIRCECGFEYARPTIDAEEQVLRCRCGHLIRVRQALPPAAWGESPLEEDEGGLLRCEQCLAAEEREPNFIDHHSTPVTFADVMRYHRQRADDWRSADRPWHEEAVECLVALVNHFDRCDAECECCDMADCYLREARKAVEVDG